MKKNIVFICNGNIHRSVIAAESLREVLKGEKISKNFLINSYGLQGTMGTDLPKHKHLSKYQEEWKAVQPILHKLSIDISKHSFQKISEAAIKKANVVIAMDNKVYSSAKNSLKNQFPNYIKKIHKFSELTKLNKTIKDPAGISNKNVHKKMIEYINSTLTKKYKTILKWTD